MTPDIELLLNAPAADIRASAIRALGRIDGEHYKEQIRPLLEDAVHDVRKAAQTALRSPGQKTGKTKAATPVRNEDGSRSWTIGASSEGDNADDDDWKARLRSITGE